MDELGARGGLYRRLIERIACALSGAEAARWRGGVEPAVLELHDLSPAERALIRAWLRQDVQWLRGWQAAAGELALIERQERAVRGLIPKGRPVAPARRIRLRRHAHLCCALCGQVIQWRRTSKVSACPLCHSRLFRVGRRLPC
ncbi:hypothetical protein [Azorhizophilus paspali]|uniref:Uncharacterized protein n=1 Tax=Azorhizophilus paspali TaxID=69963 RepID=A0ABV6SMY3_AZOPA